MLARAALFRRPVAARDGHRRPADDLRDHQPPAGGAPDWLIRAGHGPHAFLALGLIAALAVLWRSPLAAALSACGGVRLSRRCPLAPGRFARPRAGRRRAARRRPDRLALVLGPVAAAALFLTLRAGGRLFHMLLAFAFGYLALQAIRNVNLSGSWPGS